MRHLIPIMLLIGCETTQESWLPKSLTVASQSKDSHLSTALSPLQFSGTILILTGAALLFVSKGERGLIPLGLGVGLTVLMATLVSLLESEILSWVLIAGLVLSVVLAFQNYKEIRSWITSMRS